MDVKDVLLPLGTRVYLILLLMVIICYCFSLLIERTYDLGVAGFIDSDSRPKVTEARYRQLMFGTDSHQARKNQVNSNQTK